MMKPLKRKAPAKKAGKTERPAEKPVAPQAPAQAEVFAKAANLFQAGRFAEAKDLFEAATTGPSPAMAHSARLHVRMCEQRIAHRGPAPATADEHYTYAVAMMNRAEYLPAREHLEQALRLTDGGDYIHYALALCLGTLGDLEGACQHLKRAIEIQPRNRAAARHDPDFAELAHRPPISELLAGGRGGA